MEHIPVAFSHPHDPAECHACDKVWAAGYADAAKDDANSIENAEKIVEAARKYIELIDTFNYPEGAALYPYSLRAALIAYDDEYFF